MINPLAYGFTELPKQTIPESEKDEEFKERCIDTMENIGYEQYGLKMREYGDIARMYEGQIIVRYDEALSFVKAANQAMPDANILDSLEDSGIMHFDFLRNIVDIVVQKYQQLSHKVICDAVDEFSQNEFQDEMTKRFWQTFDEALKQKMDKRLIEQGFDVFKNDFASEEEYQAYQQQVQQMYEQNTPDFIKKLRGKPFRLQIQEFAERITEDDYVRFNMAELNRNKLKDRILYGECFQHERVGLDYYRPEYWGFWQVFHKTPLSNKKAEKCEIIGFQDELTSNEIIQRIGHYLNKEQIDQITQSNATYGLNRNSYTVQDAALRLGNEVVIAPYDNYVEDIANQVLLQQFGFPVGTRVNNFITTTNSNDKYRRGLNTFLYTEGYWLSYRLMYMLKRYDEFGTVITEYLTENLEKGYLRDNGFKKKPWSISEFMQRGEVGQYIQYYEPEYRWGAKISAKNNVKLEDNIYVGGDRVPYQVFGEGGMNDVLAPVCGDITTDSIAKRVKVLMGLYSYNMNQAKKYQEKELGVFLYMDLRFMHSKFKGADADETLDNIYTLIKEWGVLPTEATSQNLEGGNEKSSSSIQMFNADMTNIINAKLQIAEYYKRLAYQQIGINVGEEIAPIVKTPDGQPAQNVSTYATLDTLFDDFAQLELRTCTMHCEVAKWVKFNDGDATVQLVDDDGIKHLLKFKDENYPLRMLRLYFQNDRQQLKALNEAKATVLSMNTMNQSVEDVIEVQFADSQLELREYLKLKKEEQQKIEELNHKRQMELQDQQFQQENALDIREHNQEVELLEIKEQYALKRQAILSSGFAKDSESFNRVFQELDLQIKGANADTKRIKSEADIQQNKLNQEQEKYFRERDLNVKEENINAKKYVSDNALAIAQTNKTNKEIDMLKKSTQNIRRQKANK